MKTKIFAALFAFSSLICASNAKAAPEDLQLQNAIKKLKNATVFVVGPVFTDDGVSPNEKALRILAQQKDASAVFSSFFGDKKASKASQLYGLLGLQWVNDAEFQKRIGPCLVDKTKVERKKGCIFFQTSAGEIARAIQKGDFKLPEPKKNKTDAMGLDSQAQNAVEMLKNGDVFIIGGMSYTTELSQGEKALRILERHKEATRALKMVLDDQKSSKTGQLYALLGLKWVNEEEFEKRMRPYLFDETPIQSMTGCIVLRLQVRHISDNIRRNIYKRPKAK